MGLSSLPDSRSEESGRVTMWTVCEVEVIAAGRNGESRDGQRYRHSEGAVCRREAFLQVDQIRPSDLVSDGDEHLGAPRCNCLSWAEVLLPCSGAISVALLGRKQMVPGAGARKPFRRVAEDFWHDDPVP
jgi:hypothetical protein